MRRPGPLKRMATNPIPSEVYPWLAKTATLNMFHSLFKTSSNESLTLCQNGVVCVGPMKVEISVQCPLWLVRLIALKHLHPVVAFLHWKWWEGAGGHTHSPLTAPSQQPCVRLCIALRHWTAPFVVVVEPVPCLERRGRLIDRGNMHSMSQLRRCTTALLCVAPQSLGLELIYALCPVIFAIAAFSTPLVQHFDTPCLLRLWRC